jgi:hypothetical protein
MDYKALRNVLEQFAPSHASQGERIAGTNAFLRKFHEDLGIKVNKHGMAVLETGPNYMRPQDFSIRGLADTFIGPQWAEGLSRSTANSYQVYEAGGAEAVLPSDLPNVSAFLGSVSGLLDAALLQDYERPDFITDRLIPVDPTPNVRQKKYMGLGGLGDQAVRRNPGEEHAAMQFTERYTLTPETYQDGLRMEVTFETVQFDQTGQVLAHANKIGEVMGLRKEKDGLRLIAGVDNPYNYGGVAYQTYVASGGFWVNTHSNPLTDWEDVNATNLLFSRMTDQETGERIATDWDVMLVHNDKHETAAQIKGASEIETRTQSSTAIRRGANTSITNKEILSSPIMDQILTDAVADRGLAVSTTNALAYWWAINTRKAFSRVENWPFTVQRAAPNDYTMLNHKILLALFVDQMHAYSVKDPRGVVRSTN